MTCAICHTYNQSSENMPEKVSKWKHMEMPQIKFATIAIKSNKLGQKPGEGTLSDTKSDFLYHTNTKYLLNQLNQLNQIKNILPLNIRLLVYNALVRPHIEYGIITWGA